jgi:anti-sigma factor RsiW
MKNLSHPSYRQMIQAAADGRLDAAQCADLDAHLATCAECRAYADEIHAVEVRLSSVSTTRLVPSPSQRQRTTAAIQSRYRRHQMNKQIFSFVGTLAAVAAAIVFFVLFGRVVPRQPALAGAATETVSITATQPPAVTPHETTTDVPPTDKPSAIQELSVQVGFNMIEPAWLPEGYSLSNTNLTYNDGQTACLYYLGHGDEANQPSLIIAQSRARIPTAEQLRDPLFPQEDIPPFAEESITLGGVSESSLRETAMDISQWCGGARLPLNRALLWQAGDVSFGVFSHGFSWSGESFVSKLEMRRIAESMTGISTILAEEVDIEKIHDLPTARAAFGQYFLSPAYLPEGNAFDYASLAVVESSTWLSLVYSNQLWISVATGITETVQTLDESSAPEIYEPLTVKGQPALYSKGYCFNDEGPFYEGCGLPASITWNENGLEYIIESFLGKDTMLAVAESMAYTDLTIADAESLAGFDVPEPTTLPEFLSFAGASYDENLGIVRVVYPLDPEYYSEPNSHALMLSQQLAPNPTDCELCGFIVKAQYSINDTDNPNQVIGEAAETVRIGSTTGQYVVGVWENANSEGYWTWNPTAVMRLRWQTNGMAFELSYLGVELEKDDLIAIAESVIPKNGPAVVNMAEIEAQAGFDVVEPGWLPSAYSLSGSAYNPERNVVCLLYRTSQDGNLPPSLVIAQSLSGPLPTVEELLSPGYLQTFGDKALLHQETVSVGGAVENQALHIHSNLDPASYCQRAGLSAEKALVWQTTTHNFVLYGQVDFYQNGNFLTLLDMRRIAEGLTGVSTISPDAVDPNRLPTVDAAQALADFSLRQLETPLASYEFLYADYRENDQGRTVSLFYRDTSGVPETWGLVFSQTADPAQTLDDIYNADPQTYEQVSVNGQPGLYFQGCWTEQGYDRNCSGSQSLIWVENGVLFRIDGILSNETAKDFLMRIAKNIQ